MSEVLDRAMVVETVQRVTSDVFSTMLGVELSLGEVSREAPGHGWSGGVMSFIGMTGTVFGTGGLCCAAESACALASSFLMTEYPAVNDEVLDAVGELTNMIFGSLKTRLEEDFGPVGMSVPTVIQGRTFTARNMSHSDWTIVTFTFTGGQVEVKVCLGLAEEERHTPLHGSKQEFILAG